MAMRAVVAGGTGGTNGKREGGRETAGQGPLDLLEGAA